MALPSVEEILGGDIFEILGIAQADDSTKQQILATLNTTLDARIVARVSELMDEAQAQKFQQLAEADNHEALVNFLVELNIDLPVIVSEEATRIRVEMAELVGLASQK